MAGKAAAAIQRRRAVGKRDGGSRSGGSEAAASQLLQSLEDWQDAGLIGLDGRDWRAAVGTAPTISANMGDDDEMIGATNDLVEDVTTQG